MTQPEQQPTPEKETQQAQKPVEVVEQQDPVTDLSAATAPAVAPAEPTTTGALIVVNEVKLEDLQSTKENMMEILQQADAENGTNYAEQAVQLADSTKLEDLDPLLNAAQGTIDALNNLSREAIGNEKLGDFLVGDLFDEFEDIQDNIDLEGAIAAIKAPESGFVKFARKCPEWVQRLIVPAYKLQRKYQKFNPEIDKIEADAKKHENEGIEAKAYWKALIENRLEALRELEVAIAASHRIMKREVKALAEDLNKANKSDAVGMQRLQQRGLSIGRLDTRALALQEARGDSILSVPTASLAMDNEETLINTMKEIRTLVTSGLRDAIAQCIQLQKQAQRAEFAKRGREMKSRARKARTELLGAATVKTHEAQMAVAEDVKDLVACMDRMGEILTLRNELEKTRRETFASVRDELSAGEARLKENVFKALKESVEDAASQTVE